LLFILDLITFLVIGTITHLLLDHLRSFIILILLSLFGLDVL